MICIPLFAAMYAARSALDGWAQLDDIGRIIASQMRRQVLRDWDDLFEYQIDQLKSDFYRDHPELGKP